MKLPFHCIIIWYKKSQCRLRPSNYFCCLLKLISHKDECQALKDLFWTLSLSAIFQFKFVKKYQYVCNRVSWQLTPFQRNSDNVCHCVGKWMLCFTAFIAFKLFKSFCRNDIKTGTLFWKPLLILYKTNRPHSIKS